MARLHQRAPRERSGINERFTRPSSGPPFTVYADAEMTRRKRHHIITDAAGEVSFRSRWWADVIEWLANEEATQYTVVTDRDRYTITCAPVRE